MLNYGIVYKNWYIKKAETPVTGRPTGDSLLALMRQAEKGGENMDEAQTEGRNAD